MPVEFLTDEQAAAFGRYDGVPTRAELERFFFLDDRDKELVAARRGDHNRLGFSLLLGTVRYLGTFLTDPLDAPAAVIAYLAEQLDIEDPERIAAYRQREKTRLEHSWAIQREYGWRDFPAAEEDLVAWVYARAWTTGEGPKRLFDGAVAWLRERNVLLPGVTTLARLVASARDTAQQRLWDTLAAALTPEQCESLDALLDIAGGNRTSELDRLSKGPVTRSGPAMVHALNRVSKIARVGVSSIDLSAVPYRRVVDLARYGLAGKPNLLRRHPRARRLSTLLATTSYLHTSSIDDALELFDLLMVTQLLSRAERESNKEKLRRYGRFARESAKLAAAITVLLEAAGGDEDISLAELWAAIEAVVPRWELRAAVAGILDIAPPLNEDSDEEWRAELVLRIATVRGFLPLLTQVLEFDAGTDGAPVLAAMRELPALMALRPTKRVPAGQLPADRITADLVTKPWQRLMYKPGLPDGVVDKAAYVFCILEQFHRHLRRRDIYATSSVRWRDPRAQLLDGTAWDAVKQPTLTALGLPESPADLLTAHAQPLDETYRAVAPRANVDSDGRLHAERIEATEDPPSLTDLRARVEAMLPRVDLPEILLEVMSWHPEFVEAFTAVSGGEPRLADIDVTIAAVLTAHAMNVGYTPIVHAEVPALTRDRISYVDQNYMRYETYARANTPLVRAQAKIPFAQALGGGLVGSVDGMRFVVPVPTVHARPNPHYFGQGRGATWLNMINDQAVGLAAQVVAGTPRDSLHLLDVIYSQDDGLRPDIIVTDTASYSDVVFGLVHLLGMQYRPQLADLPDQKLWRINRDADYAPLNTAARGRIDTTKIERHWADILRVVASIHTGAVRAYDVIRMLQRDGNPTPLGDAIAHYGRIFKSVHILRVADDPEYRGDIKVQANLTESRHGLGRHVFHGQKGELRQRYREGMEDQLGAFGLVLNCITLWNTFYINAILEELRAQGYLVKDEDVAHLSAYVRKHINVHGHYSFRLPDLTGSSRWMVSGGVS